MQRYELFLNRANILQIILCALFIFLFAPMLFVAHPGVEPGKVPAVVGDVAALFSRTAQA